MQLTAHDVIIVGAGFAGLAAARALIRHGLKVLVLEAQDRGGGRAYSAPLQTSEQLMDWGAEWVIPDMHPRVCALVEEFGGKLEPEPEDILWDVPGFQQTASYEEMRAARPGFDEGLNALQEWFDEGFRPRELFLSQKSLIEQLVENPVDQDLINAAIFPLLGADPTIASAFGLREEIRSHGRDIHLTLAPTTLRYDRNFGALANDIASQFPTGTLRLNTCVTEIRRSKDGFVVAGNDVLELARFVLVSVPVATLHKLKLPPDIPGTGQQDCAQMNAGRVVKLWGKVDGPKPDTRFSVGAPLRLLYSWETTAGVFVSAQALAEDIEGRDAVDLLSQACPENMIIEADLQNWPADRYAKASWMAAGLGEHAGRLFAQSFNGLRIMGGDVSSSWAGWMEGALISAEEAIQELYETNRPAIHRV